MQFHLAWNSVGTPNADGTISSPAFVMNNADPQLNGEKLTTDQIYDRFYKDKANLVTLRASWEFQNAEALRPHIDFNDFPVGDNDPGGFQRALWKVDAAKKAGLSDIDGRSIADIDVDALEKRARLLDPLKNALEAFLSPKALQTGLGQSSTIWKVSWARWTLF